MNDEGHKRVRGFAETVALNRGRAYLVGGAVRDELMGLPTKDIDIEVFGVSSAALRKIVESHFPNVQEVGAAFGVLHATVDDTEIDVSLPRSDVKVRPGHTGFDVNVDPAMVPEEALRRRDFTINAMLKDILSGEMIDPFGGRRDVEVRILRVVDEATFADDPLRVLRAVQLVARFALTTDEAARAVFRRAVPALHELSRDRHRDEWRKLFLLASRPSYGLHLAREIGAFDALPIVRAMKETPQEPQWYPEGDVWIHTCMVCDVAAEIAARERLREGERLAVMLAAFSHDLGKPDTTRTIDGRVRSLQHSRVGLEHVDDALTFFGFDGLRDVVAPLVLEHLVPFQLFHQRDGASAPGDGAIRSLARRLHPATIEQLLWVAEADMRGRGPFLEGSAELKKEEALEWLAERAHELAVRDRRPENILRGRDVQALGMRPGPVFGLIVRAANLLHDEDGLERDELLRRVSAARDRLVQLTSVEAMVSVLRELR